jgi:hypothetical protein
MTCTHHPFFPSEIFAEHSYCPNINILVGGADGTRNNSLATDRNVFK